MKWQGGRRGGNVEDRRGLGPGTAAGGGIGVILIALIGYFVFGVDPEQTQAILGEGSVAGEQQAGVEGTPADEAGLFVDVIGANLNDVWTATLPGYTPPTVVLYEQGKSRQAINRPSRAQVEKHLQRTYAQNEKQNTKGHKTKGSNKFALVPVTKAIFINEIF